MKTSAEFPYRAVSGGAGRKVSDSLGASEEVRIVSLAPDGLACIAGVGQSRILLSRARLPLHVHPGCIEVHLCLRGSLTFATRDGEIRCLPGHIFLTQPNDPHRLVERKRGQRHYWLLFRFPGRNGAPILGLAPKESALLCRRLAGIDRRLFPADARLKSLFQELLAVCDAEPRGVFRTLRLKSVALTILLALLASAERENAAAEPANARLTEIIRGIRENPARAVSIEELARKAAFSESRFSHLFKQATGLPPHAFIMACRMEETKRRLRDTRASVAQIARDMGFASPRHLTTQFKSFCGVTPRRFRAPVR